MAVNQSYCLFLRSGKDQMSGLLVNSQKSFIQFPKIDNAQTECESIVSFAILDYVESPIALEHQNGRQKLVYVFVQSIQCVGHAAQSSQLILMQSALNLSDIYRS